jgi:hypothetical protein
VTIPDHRIKDLASYRKVTSEPNQVAGLYFYSMLDCLVALATKVAHDFFDRPQLYTGLDRAVGGTPAAAGGVAAAGGAAAPGAAGTAGASGGGAGSPAGGTAPVAGAVKSIPEVLARLHARVGAHERFLSESQRQQVYGGLFGGRIDTTTDLQSDFGRLQRDLVNASAAFAERVFDTGVEMLRERVRVAHRPFKEYLAGVHGSSDRWSHDEALSSLTEKHAYAILRDPGIAAVFGIARSPDADWPYVEDSNGDKLVEEISRHLGHGRERNDARLDDRLMRDDWRRSHLPQDRWTRQQFTNVQRAATSGAVAIRTILDFSESGTDGDLNLLITKCYTWGSTLVTLTPAPAPPTSDVPMPVDGEMISPIVSAEESVHAGTG